MKKILLVLVMMIFLVGCSKEDTKKSADSEKLSLDKITITYVTAPLNVPSIVEKNKEIFKKNLPNVEVNYANITSGAEQTEALASGDVQILYGVGGSSIISGEKSGVKILNMYSRAPEAFAIFSKDGNIKSPMDLKNKKVAGPIGTNLHELLVAYLNKENLKIEDVDFVNMSIPDSLAAVENGSVDVALLGGAAAYKAEQMGLNKVADGKGLIEAVICVGTTQKFYDEHKDIVDRFMASQKEIAEFMEKNKGETKELVKSELNIDDKAYDKMFGQYDFSTKISESDMDGLRKTSDFMFNSGMIKNKVDVSKLLIEFK